MGALGVESPHGGAIGCPQYIFMELFCTECIFAISTMLFLITGFNNSSISRRNWNGFFLSSVLVQAFALTSDYIDGDVCAGGVAVALTERAEEN